MFLIILMCHFGTSILANLELATELIRMSECFDTAKTDKRESISKRVRSMYSKAKHIFIRHLDNIFRKDLACMTKNDLLDKRLCFILRKLVILLQDRFSKQCKLDNNSFIQNINLLLIKNDFFDEYPKYKKMFNEITKKILE
ncbi:hypothetical protein TUBRATIS_24140 [Tubulinosema ratisbonensis]|uniref:Uncharacterized protein n=1 Tax=Tubulinosema ratisbonensis TaxID=291195 RepID=A0A437AIY2_9MICR|nr:hypothetical protein TUBRATIS_24140 [Tubulinosema ratisbonensis]